MEKEIKKALEKEKARKARSAWSKGVIKYAFDILDNMDDVEVEVTEKHLLNGADNWKKYSYGGSALIYDEDICHRLGTPSEIKKTKDGKLRPNRYETWLDVQTRALYQAARLIMKIKKDLSLKKQNIWFSHQIFQ